MRRRILIVQNIDAPAVSLQQMLETAGFEARVVHGLSQTIKCALDYRPALILFLTGLWDDPLQELLWEMGDLNRMRTIRSVILASTATADDRVSALDQGADDFLVSPISDRELLARLQAVLRSCHTPYSEEDTQTFGSLCLHREGMEVSIGDRRVKLTSREFGLLTYLMERPGQVLSRDELLENVWYPSREIDDQRTVDVYILRLREKIEDDPSEPSRIITRRGEGYSLVGRN